MTSKLYRLGSCSVFALVMVGSAPALAAGTAAGTSITNNATVNYQVGGVAQNSVTDGDTIIVDRRIDVTVAEVGNVTTTVVPGQSAAVTTFTVLNSSNQTLDFLLTASQTASGTASHGGTDNFDLTGLSLFRDTNANGTYDSGTDTAVTFLDELAADATVTIFAVGNVPLGRATNDVANINLLATVREGGASGSQGVAITATVGANTAGVDTVFADAAGTATGDIARDGQSSDNDDYTVQTATITVDKRSTLISDPVNNTTNPKLIPGAVVEYCIAVSNAAGGAAASTITISDVLPANLTFVTGSILLNGTTTGLTCNADGTAGGTYTAGTRTIAGSIATVAAGATRTVVFRATVD